MKKIDPTFVNIVELVNDLISRLDEEGLGDEIDRNLFEDLKEFSSDLKEVNVEKISDFIGYELDSKSIRVFPSDYSAKVLLHNFERNSNEFDLEGMVVLNLPCVFVDDIKDDELDDVYYSLNFKHDVKKNSIQSKLYEILSSNKDRIVKIKFLRELLSNKIDNLEAFISSFLEFDTRVDFIGNHNKVYELEFKVYKIDYDEGFNRCMKKWKNFNEILEEIEKGMKNSGAI